MERPSRPIRKIPQDITLQITQRKKGGAIPMIRRLLAILSFLSNCPNWTRYMKVSGV